MNARSVLARGLGTLAAASGGAGAAAAVSGEYGHATALLGGAFVTQIATIFAIGSEWREAERTWREVADAWESCSDKAADGWDDAIDYRRDVIRMWADHCDEIGATYPPMLAALLEHDCESTAS